MNKRCIAAICLLPPALCTLSRAQTGQAAPQLSITGTVLDQRGSAIPNAAVILRNESTDAVQKATRGWAGTLFVGRSGRGKLPGGGVRAELRHDAERGEADRPCGGCDASLDDRKRERAGDGGGDSVGVDRGGAGSDGRIAGGTIGADGDQLGVCAELYVAGVGLLGDFADGSGNVQRELERGWSRRLEDLLPRLSGWRL